MRLSPREAGLDSLFKEAGVFKALNLGASKRSTNSNFRTQISSSGVGGLPREGVGPKSLVCLSQHREN